MISHGNMLAVFAACQFSDIRLSNKDRHLSYLPSAHIFEKVVSMGITYAGGKIGFYRGDVLKLKEVICFMLGSGRIEAYSFRLGSQIIQ